MILLPTCPPSSLCSFFFFNDTATTEIYTLPLHDALPISYADLARASDREQECRVCIPPAGRAEQVTSDNRHRVAGERCRVGGEVVQQRGDEGTSRSPQCQAGEKQDAIVWEGGDQHHAYHGADKGADNTEPPLAQRCPELRLTYDRRRSARPVRIVELEPECDVERE